MLIKINKLFNILKNIRGGIKKTKKNPITEYILIKKINEKIFCVSINEDLEIVACDTLNDDNTNFEILIKYDIIYNICKTHDENLLLKFIKTKNSIEIYTETSIFKLPQIDNLIFPSFFNEKDFFYKIKIKTVQLKEMLNIALLTTSENNPKIFLNGISISINKNKLNIASSDGFRIGFSYIFLEKNYEKLEVIIPKNTISEVINTFNNDEYTILAFYYSHIKFITNNLTITSRLINDVFNYPKLELNSSKNQKITIDSLKFKENLNKISIFCNPNSKIEIITEDENLFLKTTNNYENAHTSFINLNKNLKTTLIIQFKFLNDILKIIKSNIFDIIITDKKKYIIITENNKKYIYIIIPLNIF